MSGPLLILSRNSEGWPDRGTIEAAGIFSHPNPLSAGERAIGNGLFSPLSLWERASVRVTIRRNQWLSLS
jgi:hypothetical protein